MVTTIRSAAATATFAAFAGWSAVAAAGSTTYTLTRVNYGTVGDTMGGTQYEGGTFKNSGGKALGYYNIVRRSTTGGSSTVDTAATSVTLLFTVKFGVQSSIVPSSIVAEGVHDFNGGGFTGGISAASPAFNFVRGGGAAYSSPSSGGEKLTLTWTGSKTLP